MNRNKLALIVVVLVALGLAIPVSATAPIYDTGTWDNFSVGQDPDGVPYVAYDLHGLFEGTVIQPSKPGRSQQGTFDGCVTDRCGVCLVNVVTFGKKGEGHGNILQCEGELWNLQGTFKTYLTDPVSFTGTYEAWYHFEP